MKNHRFAINLLLSAVAWSLLAHPILAQTPAAQPLAVSTFDLYEALDDRLLFYELQSPDFKKLSLEAGTHRLTLDLHGTPYQLTLVENSVRAPNMVRTLTTPDGVSQAEDELFGTAGSSGTICRQPDRAYVVLEEYPINVVGLLAHELGHSLNGKHDDVDHGDTRCAPNTNEIGPVLCGTVEAGSDYYSEATKEEIESFVASNSGA